MIDNIVRCGAFSSSEIWKLTTKGKGALGFGAPAITYIKEKNLERKLGRSIKTESYSRAMAWGHLIEKFVFDEKLGLEYEIHSKTTDVHPEFNFWVGSKDLLVKGKKIGEIKCYEPKHFAEYTDALLTKDTEFIKNECPEEYWQCVSNAIINQVKFAEAITYIPYKSELAAIREYASNYDAADQWKYRFIVESDDTELAFIPDGGYYKNLNRFEFEVPEEDKKYLTACVLKAKSLLVDPTNKPEESLTLVDELK